MKSELERAIEAAAGIVRSRPKIGIICGSGWNAILRNIERPKRVSFKELFGAQCSPVPGHDYELVQGSLGGKEVWVCAGRFHFYQGLDLDQIGLPIRLLHALGVKELVLTNAAGGINPRYRCGGFMLVKDHINGTWMNPLRGICDDNGPPFLDLSRAYDSELREEALAAAKPLDIPIDEGVYAFMSGPTYETPAEIEALRRLGADAVGMSTVPEVIFARYIGMKVLAISCITNPDAGLGEKILTHEDVLATLDQSKEQAALLISEIVRRMARRNID